MNPRAGCPTYRISSADPSASWVLLRILSNTSYIIVLFSGFVNDFFDGFCWKCGDCIFYGNIRKCNLLKQIIFLRQHPIPMLPLLLFFPFFRPLPLFFFLLFHHPQSPEKRTQHLRALFFQHAALDLHLMVKLVHFQHI